MRNLIKREYMERRRIEDLYKQFPDVHPNIVLKTEILRLGRTSEIRR